MIELDIAALDKKDSARRLPPQAAIPAPLSSAQQKKRCSLPAETSAFSLGGSAPGARGLARRA